MGSLYVGMREKVCLVLYFKCVEIMYLLKIAFVTNSNILNSVTSGRAVSSDAVLIQT